MKQILKKFLRRALGISYYPWFMKYEVSVLVLSWNRPELTKKCVRSLANSLSQRNAQIIILDNDSEANAVATLKKFIDEIKYPIELVCLGRNLGGKAFNKVALRARGEYILFCENDLEFKADWFDEMTTVFESNSRLGQLSPLSAIPDSASGEVWTAKPHQEVSSNGTSFLRTWANVGTTSLVPHRVLQKGVFWKNLAFQENSRFCFPDDGGFSAQIQNIGYEIGWMKNPVAKNIGHHESEWKQNPSYYQDNWAAKVRLGIDQERSAKGAEDFELAKLKQENESLKSRLRMLQRQRPELFQPHELVPEVGRAFVAPGEDFQANAFEDFQFIPSIECKVQLNLSSHHAKKIRIDACQYPARVQLSSIRLTGANGEVTSISNKAVEEQLPKLTLELPVGIYVQLEFMILVRALS